jgi:hypothetical protein
VGSVVGGVPGLSGGGGRHETIVTAGSGVREEDKYFLVRYKRIVISRKCLRTTASLCSSSCAP